MPNRKPTQIMDSPMLALKLNPTKPFLLAKSTTGRSQRGASCIMIAISSLTTATLKPLAATNCLATILLVALTISMVAADGQEPELHNSELSASSKSPMKESPVDEQHQLARFVEPRQYFKIHVAPSQSGGKRSLLLKQLHAKRMVSNSGPSQSSSPEPIKQQQQQQQSQSANQAGQKSKAAISNAKLKKLLNQSLLKSANGSASISGPAGSSKGSNFKFVFIQRATAPPSSELAKKLSSLAPASAPHSGNNDTTNSFNSAPGQQQASLAASISKQLASSLLNSAANLVANLTSPSMPSLTSLASQLISSQLAPMNESKRFNSNTNDSASIKQNSIEGASSKLAASGEANGETSPSGEDIKRIQPSELVGVKKPDHSSRSQSSGNKVRTSRPSKVYNLPVKFVANGRPTIVFSTIKQHFATIKKLQQQVSSSGLIGSQQQQQQQMAGKRRKNNGGQKFKANSRLIYLPLKYLSNARPNKLISISGKATHKSNS